MSVKRSVIKHGPASFIISLPSSWIKRYQIKKGDEVSVVEQGSSLIVTPQDVKTDFTLEQDISNLTPRLVDRLLARSYQKGYDQMHLFYNDIAILETIQKKVHELIGYEIIEQGEKSCTIRIIASKIDLDFDNSLKRAFLMVKQMAESCIEAYTAGDKNTLNNLHLKDLEVNRMCYFCLRQINKEQITDRTVTQRTHILYYLIEELEDLGDCYKKLAQELALCQKNADLLKLLQMAVEHYALSYQFFYKPTKEGANKAFSIHTAFKEANKKLLTTKLSTEQLFAIYSIRDTVNIAYHYTTMRLDTLKD